MQRLWGDSGISWTVCKSFAPRSRQITMPTPHHSFLYGPDALPAPNQQRQNTKGNSIWYHQANIQKCKWNWEIPSKTSPRQQPWPGPSPVTRPWIRKCSLEWAPGSVTFPRPKQLSATQTCSCYTVGANYWKSAAYFFRLSDITSTR